MQYLTLFHFNLEISLIFNVVQKLTEQKLNEKDYLLAIEQISLCLL